jgi:hypothetical protein
MPWCNTAMRSTFVPTRAPSTKPRIFACNWLQQGEAGSPWENGYYEAFNSKPRNEFLNGEISSSPRGHTHRWGTGHRHQVHDRPKQTRRMEKWKAQKTDHFATPPTALTG